MIKLKNKRVIYIIVFIIFLIILDQITKILVTKFLSSDEVIIENILEVKYIKNNGVAFGVASSNKLTILISNLIVIGLIIRFMVIQNERINNVTMTVLCFIVAGGISNLIDRLFRGFVIDFIMLIPKWNLPIINIADILIFVGWISLAFIFAFNTYKEYRKKEEGNN